jgi:hypothetical protein
MQTINKAFLSKKVLSYQLVAFTAMIALIWLDEILDLPHFLLGSIATPVNWRESLFETLIIAPFGLVIIRNTKILFSRMKYLEGFLRICSSCKKICDEQGNWQQIEMYIHERSGARFSHGICPRCAEKLYPEVFATRNAPTTIPRV